MPRGEGDAASTSEGEVTQLLRRWRDGDAAAREQLLAVTYEELRRIARSRMRGERQGSTLQPTALVHEAFLRLFGASHVEPLDRTHYFALASSTMRRLLVDRARARLAQKRRAPSEAPAHEQGEGQRALELLDLDRALERLSAEHPRAARVVELRYFAGLENEEIAAALEISESTVKREWTFARAWLLDALRESEAS